MPQLQLPIFAPGVTHITAQLAFEKRDGRVTYFHGTMPVFCHDEGDVRTFRMITSQFCDTGAAKQAEIVNAFGVPLSTVKRYCSVYRRKGPAGFYSPRPTRGPAVLTDAALEQAQQLLDEGEDPKRVAERLSIKIDTFRKAIRAGRLHPAGKKKT